MLYVIKTGDSDSDLFVLKNQVLPKLDKNLIRKNFDCDNPIEFEKFLTESQSLSMFANEKKLYVLYNLKTNAKEKTALSKLSYEEIILMNPSTKVFSKSASIKIFDTKLTLPELKKYISTELAQHNIDYVKPDDIIKFCGIYDARGSVIYSPLQAGILLRQIAALHNSGNKKQVQSLLLQKREFIDHWQMTSMLFEEKKTRDSYFTTLFELFDIYEVLNTLKSNLLLLGIIARAQTDHIDSTSIAKILEKNPFYVQNLLRTVSHYRLTATQITTVLGRLLNLETRVKSGEIDDPDLAFSIFIALL